MEAKVQRGIRSAIRVTCGCVLVAVFALAVTGCGQSGGGARKVDQMGGATTSDQDKIKQHLDAAGIKGEIYQVVDKGNEWVVEVGVPQPAPGKGRAPPPTPTTFLVDKASGKVTNTVIKQ
jgi:hypothetical protein